MPKISDLLDYYQSVDPSTCEQSPTELCDGLMDANDWVNAMPCEDVNVEVVNWLLPQTNEHPTLMDL
jgi:hypothetical protein